MHRRERDGHAEHGSCGAGDRGEADADVLVGGVWRCAGRYPRNERQDVRRERLRIVEGAGGRSCARADDAVFHRPHGLLVLRRAEGGNLRHSGVSAGSSEADDFRRPDGLPDVHA